MYCVGPCLQQGSWRLSCVLESLGNPGMWSALLIRDKVRMTMFLHKDLQSIVPWFALGSATSTAHPIVHVSTIVFSPGAGNLGCAKCTGRSHEVILDVQRSVQENADDLRRRRIHRRLLARPR